MLSDELFLQPNIGPPPTAPGAAHFRDAAAFTRFSGAYLDGMRQLPAFDEARAVETAAGHVRAYRFGRRGGVPIVLLSGRQASTPVWRANIASLCAHHDVWSIDSIGEPGASTQTGLVTSAADQARWVDSALTGLQMDQVHLMGVSIGGWLAAQVAIHAPGRLASVILLDPAVTFAPFTWKMVAVSLGSVVPGMPQFIRHRLLSWISGGVRSDDSVPEGRLISAGMRDFVQHQPTPAQPSAGSLRAITVPMLVLLAGDSIAHDSRRAAVNARTVPGAQVEVWPGTSHAINGERPDEIAARVKVFLQGIQ